MKQSDFVLHFILYYKLKQKNIISKRIVIQKAMGVF